MTTRTTSSRTGAASAAAWIILAVLLLFSIAAPLNQFKVPPIMPLLMDALGLSVSGAGLLMSVYAVTGLILALPAGFILQRVGFRVTGLIAGGSIVLGGILGALSQSTGSLLASRVIEGAGTSFMAVLAPALIAQWFAASKRGTAMGIWSAWVPLGTAATLIVAPPLAQAAGWRAVWWLGVIYALVVTVLYLVVARPAPQVAAGGPDGAPDGSPAFADAVRITSRDVLRNRNIWLLSVAFAAFNAAAIASGTYLPTFLSTQRGIRLRRQRCWRPFPRSSRSSPRRAAASCRTGSGPARSPTLSALRLLLCSCR